MQKKFTHLIILVLIFSAIFAFNLNAENISKDKLSSKKVTKNTENIALLSETGSESPEPEPLQSGGGILGKETIQVINLGPVVNYNGLDYAPTISADGRTLFYVSDRPGSKWNTETNSSSHDFWAVKKADRLDTNFFEPYNIDTTTIYGNLGVNTQYNEGASSIAADRQSLYFTGCSRPDGLGSCDIYKTSIEGDKWGKPFNLGPNVNSEKWESQPSITAGQDRLYFVSNRPGPNGDDNFDIWYSDYDWDTEEWKPAENLKQINTSGKEFSPFIGADGVTLFFASDSYKPNYGKLDFYVTKFDESTGKWSQPENLGEWINTSEDESFITLPASGDIIYWSSKRDDKPGYQGSYDLFMAFVPSFYKTKILKVTVIDECSQEFIPAQITIKNPVTGKTYKDSVTIYKKEHQIVLSNADFTKEGVMQEYADIEITSHNDKYGETTKIQRINKPGTTERQEEAGAAEDEILVTLTMGQMPILNTEIDEAEHVKQNKLSQPEIANFRGLVMKEVQTWNLYPLLNYVFFDLGSAELPSRYILFKSSEDTKLFTDTTIAGGTLDKYYHILNIFGFRLNQHPESKIEIVGCNDGTYPEEKSKELSAKRAQVVYDYLKNVWGISENRMKIVVRDKPLHPSNVKDSLGVQENRRVELLCNDWEIMKPVFETGIAVFPQPDQMKFVMNNGIEDILVKARRIEIKHGNNDWSTLTDIGTNNVSKNWDWYSKDSDLPKDEVPFKAQLIITTTSDKECKSPEIEIPVMQAKVRDRIVSTGTDSTDEKYSLILFPFDSPNAGPLNERIMKDYVYSRIFPSSTVQVIGHTDVVGLYEHNQKLSERRSNTVFEGIKRTTKGTYGTLNTRGVGEDEPLYDNTLPEGRFYNRTVQVLIKTPLTEFEK